jgi:carbamoyltransferase
MLLTADVLPAHRTAVDISALRGLDKLAQLRSNVPAITHVDYSARLQTVDALRSPRYHKLIRAFHELTGCPMLINTSFNVRGEPIVCTPADALRCFLATGIDTLVLGGFILAKADQPGAATFSAESYLASFALD